MAFSDFRSYDQVIAKYGLGFRREDFVPINRKAPFIDEYFRQDIAFVLKHFAYQRSDPAAAEALIFPILKELWKSHCETLTLLSHEPLQYDEELTGVVDYAVCNRSSLGTMLPGHPFLLLVGTAKDDHFDRGWGQAYHQWWLCEDAILTSCLPFTALLQTGNTGGSASSKTTPSSWTCSRSRRATSIRSLLRCIIYSLLPSSRF